MNEQGSLPGERVRGPGEAVAVARFRQRSGPKGWIIGRWGTTARLFLRRASDWPTSSGCTTRRTIGGHPVRLGKLVVHFLGRHRWRVVTRRMGIVLEIPDQISGLCQLAGVASHRDCGDSRGRKIISRPWRADVGIDDV